MAKKIVPFQLVGGNDVFQLGPRYTRPYDDTTVLSVFHRTTGGGVSWLIEEGRLAIFAEWLMAYDVEITDIDSFLRIQREDGGTRIRCGYRSASGSRRSVLLSTAQRDRAVEWIMDKDEHGWEGWRSGRRAEAGSADA